MKLPIINVESQGHKFLLFENDSCVTDILKRGERYESHIRDWCETYITKEDVVYDIGANLGAHTIPFAEYAKEVHAFEPQRLVYYQLCGNVIQNKLDNVYCYQMACGAARGQVGIEEQDFHSTSRLNIGDTHTLETGSIPCVALDEMGLPPPRMMKIDIQGYEEQMLRGAQGILRDHRPQLFIEIEEPHLRRHKSSTATIVTMLQEMGYSVKKYRDYDYIATP